MKTKFLKNYTSEVPVHQTIFNIEKVLIQCGVSGIMKEYCPATVGEIRAINFQIETANGKLTVRLPADPQKCHDALWLDYVNGDKLNTQGDAVVSWSSRKKKTKADFKEQAAMTAWKIIQDWVEVQMSMIALKQADTLQVFLPYIDVGGRPFYQALSESNFKGLLT